MLLVKINAEEDTLTAQEYSVMGYPTSVMVDLQGNEVDRLIGFDSTQKYIGTFRDYAQGIGTLDDLLSKFEANPDRAMAFEIGDKYKYRGKIDESRGWYEKVIAMGEPTDSLSGESRFALGDAYRRSGDYKQALDQFNLMIEQFKGTDFAEGGALYKALTLVRMGDTTRAVAAFEQFVADFPESDASEYARGRVAELTAAPADPDTLESKAK
jgi:tetratricopeptide (TPR) repeat protein